VCIAAAAGRGGAKAKTSGAAHGRRWKYKTQEYKRELRRKCKECFELIDADKNETLDKKEVALMMGKMRKEFRCAASYVAAARGRSVWTARP
jgi:hypothetical protein